MEAVAATLADVAMVIATLALWVVVALAGIEFFWIAPQLRREEEERAARRPYGVMPPSQREFFITPTNKSVRRRWSGPDA